MTSEVTELPRCGLDRAKLAYDLRNTPDSWIPRSPELLRLTGKHPLNAEPNQLRLFEAGLITPTK